jgi:hypothetical protein
MFKILFHLIKVMNWPYDSAEVGISKPRQQRLCVNVEKINYTYQTHWLLCAAIASKVRDGLQLTKQHIGCFELEEIKEDSQMSTGPLYLRNMFRLTYISKETRINCLNF